MELGNKILLDLERLRYPNSGIANVFRNLAIGLSEINPTLQLSIFGPEHYLQSLCLSFNIINRKSYYKWFASFQKKFQVIHISNQLSSYFHKNYQNTKKIVTLHDLNFLHENLPEEKRKKMLRKVNNNLKNADYIVCISNFVKKDFLENKHLFQLNKLKEIAVIHNGIKLPEERKYALGRFQAFENKKFILNIGVLFEKKNQLSIVEMLPFIEEDLVLISSDEKSIYAEKIRQKIQDLGLENRVHFLHNVSEEEKYALIQNAQSMIHPSLAEGFGIPPIEAMAFGKPVFLSNFTSLPEIGGDVAFYFDDFEPQKMANFYQERMNLYRQNLDFNDDIKKWVQQFDYRTMSKNYLEFYQKVLIS